MIRALLDQGLPRSAVRLLREAGWDVVHTRDIGLATASDMRILERARAEQRMVVTLDADFHRLLATSGANDCPYCVVAHGAILRVYAKNPFIADQVALNYRKADITPRQKAMLDFALKVALHSAELAEADYAVLRVHGFSEEDIWDIGAIAAFFALSNRMAALIDMRPNDEFYLLGRVPKEKPSR